MRVHFAIGFLVAVFAPAALAQRNVEFDPGCALPFESIKVTRWIDGHCGPEGSAGSDAGKVQNRAKNDFCAGGPATDLTIADFRALQKAADDAGVYRKPQGIPSPAWRNKLRDIWEAADGAKIGEGERVRFVGYIDKVFPAGEDTGESVNCKIPGSDNNDIHLELGETQNPRKCDRLVTEISPHFRPAKWTVGRLAQVSHQGHPVRVTGHLFWDASHSPCGQGEPEQWRATTWEIHPAYRIEVCAESDLAVCRSGDDSLWLELHEWGEPWVLDDTEEALVQSGEDEERGEIMSEFGEYTEQIDSMISEFRSRIASINIQGRALTPEERQAVERMQAAVEHLEHARVALQGN